MNPFKNGFTLKKSEVIAALLLLCVALITLYDSYMRGWGWASDGPQSGYFPARIAGILLIASLFILFGALKAKDKSIVDGDQLKLVATILIPLCIYISSIAFLGIYLASAIFLAAFMVFIGKFAWWKAIFGGLLCALITFYVFEVAFRVPLPKGFVEKMLGF